MHPIRRDSASRVQRDIASCVPRGPMRRICTSRPLDRSVLRRSAAFALVAAGFVGACGSSDSPATTNPPAGVPSTLREVDSVTFGDALCGAPSPDGALYAAAEGAALTILDGPALADPSAQPIVLGRAEITAAPMALVFDPPHVFVAGGTAGLWRVTIGDGTAAGGKWPEEVHVLESNGAVCLDVVGIEGHPAGSLIAAALSARIGFGTSELVVVDRDPPHALRARVPIVPSSGAPGAKMFALAADPMDPTRVYVAMGTAGVWRVDLADLAQPVVTRGPVFNQPSDQLDGQPAAALDIDTVRVGERALLFAAIDRGGVAQIDVSPSVVFAFGMPTTRSRVECDDPDSGPFVPYGYRVSALGRSDGRVLVALATNDSPAERTLNGPFSTLGRWSFDLDLPGPLGAPTGCKPHTFLLRTEVPSNDTDPIPTAQTIAVVGNLSRSRSIEFVAHGGEPLLFEDRFQGAHAFAFTSSVWTADAVAFPPRKTSFAGLGLAIVDGTASELEPGLLYFGHDGISGKPNGMPRFDFSSGRIESVEGTILLCAESSPQFCNSSEAAIVPPNPWRNGITGGARWLDVADPGREWFAGGKTRVSRQCAADPCAWSEDWCFDPWLEEGDAPLDDLRPPGWEIVRLDSAAAAAGAAAMDMRFWSIASPVDVSGRTGRNYFGSADGAERGGQDRLLHLFRGAIREGYLVCSATDVVQRALASCDATTRGRGQRIEPAWMHVLSTHYELEPNDLPDSALTWRGHEFTLDVGGAQRTYMAVSSGWVLPVARAPWDVHANRGMIVVYDVTDVDADTPPALVRFLLGPPGVEGNLVAARTLVREGRTWLFAGDLAGAAHAFDVSATQLVDAAPTDPSDPATAIAPAFSWYAPPDVYDGERANVTDLEVDAESGPPIVILANARRGIAVLEVDTSVANAAGIELREAPESPIDTPGITSGLVSFRHAGVTWVAVGDSRCGIRMYGRLP